MDKGLLNRKQAKKRLDPHMTDEEIDDWLADVDAEKEANAAKFGPPVKPDDKEETEEEEEEEEVVA
jgi:hypothetical protein